MLRSSILETRMLIAVARTRRRGSKEGAAGLDDCTSILAPLAGRLDPGFWRCFGRSVISLWKRVCSRSSAPCNLQGPELASAEDSPRRAEGRTSNRQPHSIVRGCKVDSWAHCPTCLQMPIANDNRAPRHEFEQCRRLVPACHGAGMDRRCQRRMSIGRTPVAEVHAVLTPMNVRRGCRQCTDASRRVRTHSLLLGVIFPRAGWLAVTAEVPPDS